MKKLLSFLILSFVLAPAFVFADAGGAGQGNEIPSPLDCEGYFECVCNTSAPQTDYLPVSTTATTPEACNSYCQGLTDPTTYDWSCWLGGSVMFNGVSRLEESGVIGDSASATTSAPTVPAEAPAQPLIPILNVPIPGLDWSNATTVSNGQQHSNLLGAYVNAVYAYMLGAAALIAVTMLMIAGLQYATARGDSKQVDNAKKRINNAVVGIILLLLAYNIAFIVNPATVKFKSLDIQVIKGIEVDDETPVNFSESFVATTAEGLISVPLYNQKDYADVAYGPESCKTATSGNIKSSGCGVTSFAMVLAALTNKTVAPPDIAQSFYEDGYRPINPNTGCGENGTYNSAMYESPLIEASGLRARQIPFGNTQELMDLVSKGKLIITSYKTPSGGGHYVVISGYDDKGNLIVNNPYGGKRELRSNEWWFSTIKSAAYIDTAENFIE